MRKVHRHRILAQRGEAKEHERKAKDKFAKALHAAFTDVRKHNTKPEERPHVTAHVELETEQRHNPRRRRCTDVRTHNHGNGLLQGQQARIHKAHRHDSGRGRRLHSGSHKRSCQKPTQTMLGHGSENGAEVATRKFLQAFAHRLHAEHEEM